MTAETAAPDNAAVQDALGRVHQLPLHNAPSMHDLLAMKRQRRSLDENEAVTEARQDLSLGQRKPNASNPRPACDVQTPKTDVMPTESAPAPPQTSPFLTLPTFTTPVLPAVPGEPMSGYFQRLGAISGVSELIRTASLECDGIYLHKRPIRAPNGASPLAVCGSVLHHVMVLVRQGPRLHTLDFGPANGADVTANILEDAEPKGVLTTQPAAAAAAITAEEGEMPYMYLGLPKCGIDHPLVQQLIAFVESRPYNALRNNCIHFADALVRVLTAGAVRSAPLLYDMSCGSVPAVDNPMLLMMQLMLRIPWFSVVDGSPLAAAFLERCRQEAAAAGEAAENQAEMKEAYNSDNDDGDEDDGDEDDAQRRTCRGAARGNEGAQVPSGRQQLGAQNKLEEEEGDLKHQRPAGDVVSESRVQPCEEEWREEQENDHAMCEVVEAVKA
ncbi:hypothetical protein VaNZ11_010177 [Volvox africanus]|uniref:PPPDE domain-containing protein n=1 Tax=Volvox africanus TaxID=51714 RepID=A0ABQ5S9T8_9CHLO|nr:hypothetical protein VaNZ11_010177 [Volvox africanus]